MTKKVSIEAVILSVAVGSAAALSGCAGMTPGRAAVQQGDTAQLKKILDQPNHGGEDINGLFDDSLLHFDCVECAKILFSAGAKAVETFWTSRPAGLDYRLAWAAIDGHEKIAQFLIDHGAEPTAAIKYCPDQATAKEFFAKVERDRMARAAEPAPAARPAEEPKPAPAADATKPWWGK